MAGQNNVHMSNAIVGFASRPVIWLWFSTHWAETASFSPDDITLLLHLHLAHHVFQQEADAQRLMRERFQKEVSVLPTLCDSGYHF
jgi:hypothetical protein